MPDLPKFAPDPLTPLGKPAYAGIGSRKTPKTVVKTMRLIAAKLEQQGWILRSGGAEGADSAFEDGIVDRANMEIFLPGAFFNGKSARGKGYINATQSPAWPQALETVYRYHPAPEKLSSPKSDFGLRAMARNAMQVLGYNLDSPSKMVIAWTLNGEARGGTGQALRIAHDRHIPILNLGKPGVLQRAHEWLLDAPYLEVVPGETPF